MIERFMCALFTRICALRPYSQCRTRVVAGARQLHRGRADTAARTMNETVSPACASAR